MFSLEGLEEENQVSLATWEFLSLERLSLFYPPPTVVKAAMILLDLDDCGKLLQSNFSCVNPCIVNDC